MSMFQERRSSRQKSLAITWDALKERNSKWWQLEASTAQDNPFSDYDRTEIINDNGSPDVIVRLNCHIITTNSQCGKFTSQPTIPHPEYVKFVEARDGVSVGKLDGCLCAEHHRPYLCALVDRRSADRFPAVLSNFAVMIDDSSKIFPNLTFNSMRDSTGHGVNVTKSEFFEPNGKLVCTLFPTNIWAVPSWDKNQFRGVPRSALEDAVMVTVIGREYRDDGGQMLHAILGLFE